MTLKGPVPCQHMSLILPLLPEGNQTLRLALKFAKGSDYQQVWGERGAWPLSIHDGPVSLSCLLMLTHDRDEAPEQMHALVLASRFLV